MWTLIWNKMQNSPVATAVPPVDLSQPHLLLLSLHTISVAVTNSFSISEFCHFENVIELYHMWSLEIGFFAHSAEVSWHSSKLFPVSIVLFYCWLVVWYGCTFVQPFTCGRTSGWFQFGAIMNKAAMYIHAQVFVWTWFSFLWDKCPRVQFWVIRYVYV